MDDISDHVSVDFATCRAGRSLPQCFGVVQLCQVYDSAEFCRNVHANQEWQRQAVEAIMLTASKHLMHTSSYTALRGNHLKTSWMTLEHLHRLLAEYIQELNMHQGLYSAVVRSLQHYDRLQSHAGATTSSATPANFANKEVCSSITLCWSCMACLLLIMHGMPA